MVRIGLFLTGGNLAVAILSLARNVLVARLISVPDFGIAVTFAISMAMVETLSALALDRLIVQAREGDDPEFEAALHGLQVARGAIGAALLYLLARPYAAFLGVPEIAWAYELTAVVPLARGFAHLDIFRLQRRLSFGPWVTVNLASQIVAVAVVLPLVGLFGDWRAMLASILLQHGVFVVLSHVLAERRYALAWRRAVLGRSLQFGLPLVANAVMMFAIFQGDRLIVGNRLGLVELGHFSVAATLTLVASTLLANTLQSLFLPQLARLQDQPLAFEALARVAIEGAVLAAAALAVGFALLGPPVMVLLFGAKYAPALGLLVWLAVVQALRVARTGPAVVAIACGDTRNPMLANIARVAMLPVSFVALTAGADMLAVAWIALVGEVLSLAVALALLGRRTGLRLAGLGLPLGALAGLLGLIGFDAAIWTPGPAPASHFHAAQIGLLAAFAIALPSLGTLRGWLRLRRRTGRRPVGSHARD